MIHLITNKKNISENNFFSKITKINFDLYQNLNEVILDSSNKEEYVLLWDTIYGDIPDKKCIKQFIDTKIDVWHGGTIYFNENYPDCVNIFDPLWLYNVEVSDQIVHTSYKLSLRSLFIKKKF